MSNATATRRRKWRNLSLGGAAVLLFIFAFPYPGQGIVKCSLLHVECQPWRTAPEMPDWRVPSDPDEKQAYDFAHGLSTPAQAPPIVPFDFRAARIAELEGGKSLAQQYFEHLCATEDSEVIVERAKDVDGFLLLRPRGHTEETPADRDRYGTEEPVGFGWLGDHDQTNTRAIDLLGSAYVQPLFGVYSYVEFVDAGTVVRVERAQEPDLKKYPHGYTAGWRSRQIPSFGVPYLVTRTRRMAAEARYAYTWRGLRRPRDREFAIAGAEYIVVDLATSKVLGLKRTFASTYATRRRDFTKWSGARNCQARQNTKSLSNFIVRVLNPRLTVNDAFVPEAVRAEYHNYIITRFN